jgi:hypothetical protein
MYPIRIYIHTHSHTHQIIESTTKLVLHGLKLVLENTTIQKKLFQSIKRCQVSPSVKLCELKSSRLLTCMCLLSCYVICLIPMTKTKIYSFNSKIKVISFQWPGETLISVSEIENNMTAQSTRPRGIHCI